MTITKRTDKGSALTFAEMDENIRDLREDTDLTRVLTNGNSTTLDITTTGTITAGTLVGSSAAERVLNTENADRQGNNSIVLVRGYNDRVELLRVANDITSNSASFGFQLEYRGDGTGDNNTLELRTDGQSASRGGTRVFEVKQSGNIHFDQELIGTSITANTIVTDNITVRDPGPAFVIEKLNTQSITDSTSQDITWTSPASAVKLDTHAGWDQAQSVYYECKESGWYQVDQRIVVGDANSVIRDFIAAFMESSDQGSTYAAIGSTGTRYASNDISEADLYITGLFYLTAGNYYKMKVYYNSTDGGAGTIIINASSIQSAAADDMEVDGTLTRWSMYKVMD